MNYARALKRLIRARPRSRESARVKMAMEKAIMGEVKRRGQPAAARIVEGLIAAGFPFVQEERFHDRKKRVSYVRWRLPLERRAIHLSANVNSLFRSVSVTSWPARTLTKKELAKHELQQRFYARYDAVARAAYGPRPPRLASKDRIVLLVGELEADVNNGGFSQYLFNKDRRRRLAALKALRAIGAVKTARLLSAAMSPRATEKELSRLDNQFYEVPEDLALLAVPVLGLPSRGVGA